MDAATLSPLRAYFELRLSIADEIRTLWRVFKEGRDEGASDLCFELMAKLAGDRFIVAVTGQSQSGRSSLLNALIGRDLLPTGVPAGTSAITVVKYGPDDRLIVHRENCISPELEPVSALAEYVSEKGNPRNRKNVRTACVELRLPFLRYGVEFVDTPHLISSIEAGPAPSSNWRYECDALFFVTSVDDSMAGVEREFLQQNRPIVDKIFFVLNKVDLISDHEQGLISELILDTIREETAGSDARLFPVSARLGLLGKAKGNKEAHQKSGLIPLEEDLIRFLFSKKLATFLAPISEQAIGLAEQGLANVNRMESAGACRNKAKQKPPNLERHPETPKEKLITALHNLRSLHDKTTHPENQLAAFPVALEIALNVDTKATDDKSSTSEIGNENLAKDLRIRGCPACRRLAKATVDFFAHWQHELARDGRARSDFALELGFCALHTWQLISRSSPLGTSIGYVNLVERIADELGSTASATPLGGEAVRRLVRDSKNCRVCRLLRRLEHDYILSLAAFLRSPEARTIWKQSQGLCLRHFRALIDALPAEADIGYFLADAARRFAEISEDLRSYALKKEALRRDILNKDEEDAYLRAVIYIAGEKSLCLPSEKE